MTSATSKAVAGIDATRCRSGGAQAHIRGLMSGGDPRQHGISHVHLWAHDALLDAVKPQPWLTLHRVPATRQSVLHQLFWQRYALPRKASALGVSVMLNADAGSVCPFQPSVTLSQNMLPFEPVEMRRFDWSMRDRYRLEALRHIQRHRLERSSIALFLSEHARRVVSSLARLKQTHVIAHGIEDRFLDIGRSRSGAPGQYAGGMVRCLYVSDAAPYKHQWHVVDGVARARAATGRDIRLRLVGGGTGPCAGRLREAAQRHDPEGAFVEILPFLPHGDVPGELAAADIFVFASSCENLPVTLLEGMGSGAAIASSSRGPMPEVLGPDGTYFDPEDPASIAEAITQLISRPDALAASAANALKRAADYSWQQCARETWDLLAALALRETRESEAA